MWEKDRLTIERISEHMEELNKMTERFYETALFYLDHIESLENNEQVLIRSIDYITHAHAIPPLRGNHNWFDYTLAAVVEILCPNTRLTKKHSGFLKDLENGLNDYKNNMLEEDEE